ncbi:MAG: hypothetical protein ACP5TL_01740 [Candidatus Micrarchaeia archaeon]
MSFENALKDAILKQNFGNSPFSASYKERPHISKAKLDHFNETSYINIGNFFVIKQDQLPLRYIASIDITYELLLSIYEVNTSALFAARLLSISKDNISAIEKFIKGFKRPNFEVRLIGLQNNNKLDLLHSAFDIIMNHKLPIVEIDLFGNEMRHIALDSKIGASFNILKENRLYRPGELINNMTLEQLERSINKKS